MKKRKIWIAAAAVLLALVIAVAAYAGDYYRADERAMEALAGSDTVTVEQTGDLTVFVPERAEAGLIFYPGGKVEHTAYAPLLRKLAEEDILCVLVRMPLNLAVLDMDAAEGIPEQFPEVERWYIGGHSLGGSMAASWAADNAQTFDGLILLAAYSTADLTGTELDVLSIYGSEDQVLNLKKYEKYIVNLPENACEWVIYGGNHAQFGSYGPQEGDGEATVSGEEQLASAVQEILAMIRA